MREQNFDNHAMMRPTFHYLASPALLILLVWTGLQLFRTPNAVTGMAFLAVLVLAFTHTHARIFALGVQDRVIRLEERIRMERLLPAELRERIPELGVRQLIALRFASDDELPDLTRRVLDGELTGPKEIKQAVRKWRPDYQRI